jgi:hypothetical protein
MIKLYVFFTELYVYVIFYYLQGGILRFVI